MLLQPLTVYICITLLVAELTYIAYTDYRYKYIEDKANLYVVLTALIFNIGKGSLKDCLTGLLVAFAINAALYCLFYYIYKDEVFGQGDVLLMTAIGAILGCEEYLGYYVFQSLASGLTAFGYLLIARRKLLLVPMAPVYVFWLILYLLLGKPHIYYY